jgi:hypothetical protein
MSVCQRECDGARALRHRQSTRPGWCVRACPCPCVRALVRDCDTAFGCKARTRRQRSGGRPTEHVRARPNRRRRHRHWRDHDPSTTGASAPTPYHRPSGYCRADRPQVQHQYTVLRGALLRRTACGRSFGVRLASDILDFRCPIQKSLEMCSRFRQRLLCIRPVIIPGEMIYCCTYLIKLKTGVP